MEGTSQKKNRNAKSVMSESNCATQSKNILDSSTYLTYDVMRIVFQYLNAKDLVSAAMVCRSWLAAAKNEKLTRGFSCSIQTFNSFDFFNYIKEIKIKPSVAFFFVPENTPRNLKDLIQDFKYSEIIMLYSKGIIINNKEMEHYPFPKIVCAFLPQLPNVRIKAFNVTRHRKMRNLISGYQDTINMIIDNESSSNQEMSTCLMLFCNYTGHKIAKYWASTMENGKEDKIISVWGGVVRDIQTYNSKVRKHERLQTPLCVALLITGLIQTWSIVLEENCNTKEQVEAKLELFKNEVKLKKHSIGFMFTCQARGFEIYHEDNVESMIFKRLFPKVPLVGCFGYGEFGKTTTIHEANKEKNEEEEHKKSQSWYNEFSTVFLILTYG